MDRIRLLVADRNELFREGLTRILQEEPSVEVVGSCCSGIEAVHKADKFNPEVILTDIHMPKSERAEVIRLADQLAKRNARIIILTHSKVDHNLFSTLMRGARAYVSKNTSVKDLVSTIARVHAGEVVISAPMASRLLEEFALLEKSKETTHEGYSFNLSKREREVLELVAKGTPNKEIASALFISENTVKGHLSRILEKLHVNNRQQAAALAVERGLLTRSTRLDT